MSAPTTFRLIISNYSEKEADSLISMFQSAGKPCRVKCVNDEPSLNKLLEEKSWDLLITRSNTQSLPPVNAIKLIRKLNRDVPVIIIADNADEIDPKLLINSMKQGGKRCR